MLLPCSLREEDIHKLSYMFRLPYSQTDWMTHSINYTRGEDQVHEDLHGFFASTIEVGQEIVFLRKTCTNDIVLCNFAFRHNFY